MVYSLKAKKNEKVYLKFYHGFFSISIRQWAILASILLLIYVLLIFLYTILGWKHTEDVEDLIKQDIKFGNEKSEDHPDIKHINELKLRYSLRRVRLAKLMAKIHFLMSFLNFCIASMSAYAVMFRVPGITRSFLIVGAISYIGVMSEHLLFYSEYLPGYAIDFHLMIMLLVGFPFLLPLWTVIVVYQNVMIQENEYFYRNNVKNVVTSMGIYTHTIQQYEEDLPNHNDDFKYVKDLNRCFP